MRPPPEFVRKLHAYDPDLRVVWALRGRDRWLLERRVRRSRVEYGAVSPNPDVRRRFRDGYIHVVDAPPRGLNERVLLALWQTDLWRQGGAKAVNAELDAYHEARYNKEARGQREDARQIARDMWDFLAWRRKGRVTVPVALS